MFGWIARAGMLKILGRRAVPLLAVWQVLQMVRGARRSSDANRVEPGSAPTARTLESRRRRRF